MREEAPLWIATTEAAGVTELLDRRVFAGDPVVIPSTAISLPIPV